MSWARSSLRELLGLFVEDPFFAGAIILWLAVDGLLLPRLGLDAHSIPLILVLGCAAILFASTARAARLRPSPLATRDIRTAPSTEADDSRKT